MKEMDDMLKEMFRDRPIASKRLHEMSAGIMDQIFSAPVDFQEKRRVAQRRKAGFIFLGSVIGLSLGLFLSSWLLGPWLSEGLRMVAVWLVAHVPILGWLQERWDWLFNTLGVLLNVRSGYQALWSQYGFPIMGILFSWALFEGIREKGNSH